jgi:DNA-binding transcriptional MerR regulator
MTAELLHLEEVAVRCDLPPELVHRLVVLGILDPAPGSVDLFPPEVILRVQRVVRLRRDLGVNYSGVGVILDLLDRIDELEERLHRHEHP